MMFWNQNNDFWGHNLFIQTKLLLSLIYAIAEVADNVPLNKPQTTEIEISDSEGS